MRRLVVLPLLLALTGCANSVRGEVDGRGVGLARQAWFDVYEYDLGWLGEYYYTAVLMSDVSDACDGLDALGDALSESSCEDRCEELAWVADEYTGWSEHWSLLMGAVVEGRDNIVGSYNYTNGVEEDSFSASFTWFSLELAADPDLCEDTCEDGEDLLLSDSEQGEDGELLIESYESDRLIGEFELDLGGADLLVGSFDAAPCDELD